MLEKVSLGPSWPAVQSTIAVLNHLTEDREKLMTGSADVVASSCEYIYGTFREGIFSGENEGEIRGKRVFEGNKGLNELWYMD